MPRTHLCGLMTSFVCGFSIIMKLLLKATHRETSLRIHWFSLCALTDLDTRKINSIRLKLSHLTNTASLRVDRGAFSAFIYGFAVCTPFLSGCKSVLADEKYLGLQRGKRA